MKATVKNLVNHDTDINTSFVIGCLDDNTGEEKELYRSWEDSGDFLESNVDMEAEIDYVSIKYDEYGFPYLYIEYTV